MSYLLLIGIYELYIHKKLILDIKFSIENLENKTK